VQACIAFKQCGLPSRLPIAFFLELTPPSELLREASPIWRSLVGGFADLKTAHTLAGHAVRVTLIDSRNFNLFQPLLYQVASELVAQTDVASALRILIGQALNVQFLMGE
jgi:NADH dehydrogenase